jgi:hypothetical protein
MAKKSVELARRARERAARTATKARITALATAGFVGYLERVNMLSRVPAIAGSRLVTLGLVGAGAEMWGSGTIAEVGGGLLTGAGSVAAYQFGKGQTISGELGSPDRRRGIGPGQSQDVADALRRLAREARDRAEDIEGDDIEGDELEAEA